MFSSSSTTRTRRMAAITCSEKVTEKILAFFGRFKRKAELPRRSAHFLRIAKCALPLGDPDRRARLRARSETMTEELQAGDFITASVRLLRPLAQGGMGKVWIAEHLALETQVVVKLMSRVI